METADAIPVKFLGGVYAEFQRPGKMIEESMDPNAEVQFRRFDLKPPFGPHGWNFSRFDIVIERIARPGRPPFATFFADWSVASYGRHTEGAAWPYTLVLFAGGTALRYVLLGHAGVPCFPYSGKFQGQIPPPPASQDFPFQYFQLIDNIRLDSSGHQESC